MKASASATPRRTTSRSNRVSLPSESVSRESAVRAPKATLTAALARLADGDRAAFDVVYAEAKPLVEQFVRRALTSGNGDFATDGDDIVQRTLIKIFEQCHRYDRDRSGGAWVVTLAAFEVRSVLRDGRRARARLSATDNRIADPHDGPEALAAARELLLAAEVALGQLSELDRETLLTSLSGDGGVIRGATFRKRLERATRRFFGVFRGHGYDER